MTPNRNEKCSCGSGIKYKYCCMHLDELMESGDLLRNINKTKTLNERNITLVEAINEIFFFRKSWDDVKSSMTDRQIIELHRVIEELWPPETDIFNLINNPNNRLRSLYLGDNRPDLLVDNVFRFGLYTDEIFIVEPFLNPRNVAKEYNPINNPRQHKITTLRLLYFIRMLEPWIRAKLVFLIPDPGNFNYDLRRETWQLAQNRLGDSFEPNDKDLDYVESVMKKDNKRFMYTLPDEQLATIYSRRVENPTEQETKSFIAGVRQLRRDDILALDQTLDISDGQLSKTTSGCNLEMGLYICNAISAYPFTNSHGMWEQIMSSSNNLADEVRPWSGLAKAFNSLEFKFLNNVPASFAVEMHQKGRAGGFRNLLRKVWNTVDKDNQGVPTDSLCRDYQDEMEYEYQKADADWKSINTDLTKWIGTAASAAIVSGGMSLEIPAAGFAIAGVTGLLTKYRKQAEFRQRTPMSVLIDLSKKRKVGI